LAHERDCKPDGEFARAGAKATACLRHDNPSLPCGDQVNVISMIAGLRDYSKVGQLVEKLPGEPGAFSIRNQSVESA
jgi:hypothetical protein